MGRELVAARVTLVNREPERLGIPGVDRHGHAELTGGLEDRVELRVIDGDSLAVISAQTEAEHLGYLEAARTPGMRHAEQVGHALAVVGITRLLVGEAGEHDD